MPQIIINEISNNFTYNIGENSYATVAMPITSCWGPGFFNPEDVITDEQADTFEEKLELELEDVVWKHYSATQDGIESFVSDYRGPANGYRMAKDYSYYMAITLLTAGYDVLVCRLCPGARAEFSDLKIYDSNGQEVAQPGDLSSNARKAISIKAKYAGSFGNQLLCKLYKPTNSRGKYWNLVTYVKDSSGVKTAVENMTFVLDPKNATDSIPYVGEVESSFVEIVTSGNLLDTYQFGVKSPGDAKNGVELTGGTDRSASNNTDISAMMQEAYNLCKERFGKFKSNADANVETYQYTEQLKAAETATTDTEIAETIRYREWLFDYVLDVYELLKDRLAYNPNRIIAPGWDDMDITFLDGQYHYADKNFAADCISPIHLQLMDVAYFSRCATAYLDIPRCLPRKRVYAKYNDYVQVEPGYANMLAEYEPANVEYDTDGTLYNTHSALFAPWGQYKFVGTAKYNVCPPSFMALLIQRSMVLNQSLQYEWIQPTTRSHNVKIAKLDYTIPKKVLDVWQPTDEEGGVGLNVITNIPGMGVTLWGNTTLFNNPPMTYQALRNLSTRHLVGAIKDAAYKASLRIIFTYNNAQAYSTFHAGVTPLLDTMRNCGAIEDYYVTMNHDLDALGLIKANSVIGKIYITPVGVCEKITVDLIALPPGTDLEQFK